MLRFLVDNEFINAASFYVLSAAMFIIIPPLLFWKMMFNIFRSFFRRSVHTSLKGQVVLITGASSGIGEFIAYEYARREAFLVIIARREERLLKVADKARGFGSPDVLVICGDVSNFNDCRRFIDQTISHFGRLDHLFNNAGIANMYVVNEGTEVTKFAPVMDINFWGSVYPTYFAIPYLKKTQGSIIVNSSAAGYIPHPRSGFYSASKSALISFYDSLRLELAPEINITIITLGFVESEITLGKLMSKDGEMQHHQEAKDVVFGCYPVMSTEICAKALVKGVCRGDRYITEPKHICPLTAFNFFFPEVVQWCFGKFYLNKLIAAAKDSQKHK